MTAFGADRLQRPVIVGFGATPVGRHTGRTLDDLAHDALTEALDSAALVPAALKGLYLAQGGYTRAVAPIRPQRFAERLGVPTRALVEIENGGASALLTFKAACLDVAVGHVEVAAAVGSQVERDLLRAPDAGDVDRLLQLNAMNGPYLGALGVVAAVPSYAFAAQRYLHEHDIDPRAVAALAVRLRENARGNPRAEQRAPLSIDDVLASRLVSPPIHKLEAAPWSDGAAAVIVASEGFARRHRLPHVALTGWGERHDDANFVPFGRDLTRYPWIGEALDEALARAGRSRDDLDVLELYGAFAHAELMTYEALGLCDPGEAPELVAQGATSPGGRWAINPSGGRLSLGHPPQATPLYMLGEIFEQLTGRAGDRGLDDPAIGLVQAEHGLMNGAAIAILERG